MRGLLGRRVVVSEKLDGANAGVSFGSDGRLRLQSRGHVLTGGPRERHFALFKAWAMAHRSTLFEALGDRYVIYGEWLYARHTIFYDLLPHYFVAFDVFDRASDQFLPLDRRVAVLDGLPLAMPPVWYAGPLEEPREMAAWLRPATYKSPQWRQNLRAAAHEGEVAEWGDAAPARAIAETDRAEEAEGFVISVEDDEHVLERVKWVRPSFAHAIAASGSHWLSRPILANRLAPGVELW